MTVSALSSLMKRGVMRLSTMLDCWKNSCQGRDGRADDGDDEQHRGGRDPALYPGKHEVPSDRREVRVGEKEHRHLDNAEGDEREHCSFPGRKLPDAMITTSRTAAVGTAMYLNVLPQEHFAVTPLEASKVNLRLGQNDLILPQGRHPCDGDIDPQSADLGDQTSDQRIFAPPQPDDHVVELADPLATRGAQLAVQQHGDEPEPQIQPPCTSSDYGRSVIRSWRRLGGPRRPTRL